MAARKTPVGRMWTPDIVRERIKTSMIVNRLTDHALGNVEMTTSQVTAALGLLRKSLPDQSAVTHSGGIALKRADELSDAELANIAAGSSRRVVEAQDGPEESDGVH